MKIILFLIICSDISMAATRARDLGISFDGKTGPKNAIVDIKGVEVGHKSLVQGAGKKSVRTGVSVIFPRGKSSTNRVFANWFSLNGNGEMTGTTWVEGSGILEGPIALTGTHSVGVVRDAVIQWSTKHSKLTWSLPVVAETWDGRLNNMNSFALTTKDVFEAMDSASSKNVEQGSVGGGTGMVAYGFKAGIGTSSRKVGNYTLGVLVQANYGRTHQLEIRGKKIAPLLKNITQDKEKKDGSIITVIATDAPLLPHQLKRLCKRVALGLAKLGSISMNSSGDIFLAFSTANKKGLESKKDLNQFQALRNSSLDPFFAATISAVEEAVLDSMIMNKPMKGFNGQVYPILPHGVVKELR
jgi:L-aminopeptidase/D-esterase-like protein